MIHIDAKSGKEISIAKVILNEALWALGDIAESTEDLYVLSRAKQSIEALKELSKIV